MQWIPVSTRATSDLSKELTTKYVSEALCKRFTEEVERLGISRLNVALSSSGVQKGKLYHRIAFTANPQAPLREILSEGEFRCLALATFLSEIGGTQSGILFDDPVSSLDHTWRSRIARRLAEEAKVRQVVVFTHDIAFHFLLKEAAESPEIMAPISECCIERRGLGVGFCRDEAPWAGMTIRKRIGVLKNDLNGLRRQFNEGNINFERDIRDWYGRLRESWERSIEECLLNDAVQRFRKSIETNRLKKALSKIAEGDWAAIEKGMTKCSTAIRGHDGAANLNPPVPTPDDAKQAIEEFEIWVNSKS